MTQPTANDTLDTLLPPPSAASPLPSAIKTAQALVEAELAQVNDLILHHLTSKVTLIQTVGRYILQAKAKRIRPLILLLIAKASNSFNDKHLILAAIIEYIHCATLLHDDVVDDSTQRRGKISANYLWGNATSILVGDFLHSRAYQMINSLRNFDIIDILGETITLLSEGEVVQLEQRRNPDLTQAQYDFIISCKTGTLFKAAALLGSIYHPEKAQQQQLGMYGLHLGCAFQLADDLMDYQSHPDIMGKNIGDDLKEGKVTLPLLWALQNSPPEQAQIIRHSIQTGTLKDLASIQAAIHSTGAIEYTLQKAQAQVNLALAQLDSLPDSVYKNELINLTKFSIERSS